MVNQKHYKNKPFISPQETYIEYYYQDNANIRIVKEYRDNKTITQDDYYKTKSNKWNDASIVQHLTFIHKQLTLLKTFQWHDETLLKHIEINQYTHTQTEYNNNMIIQTTFNSKKELLSYQDTIGNIWNNKMKYDCPFQYEKLYDIAPHIYNIPWD
jgi:hypothetical protein